MTSAARRTGRAMSFSAGVLAGTGSAIGILFLMIALTAKLVSGEAIREENMGYGIMAALLLSSFIGSFTACGAVKRRKLAVCASVCAAFTGTLLAITALFFGGQYEGIGVTLLLAAGGSASAALLSNREPEKRRKTGKRRP